MNENAASVRASVLVLTFLMDTTFPVEAAIGKYAPVEFVAGMNVLRLNLESNVTVYRPTPVRWQLKASP